MDVKKKIRTTNVQFEIIINYLETNKELIVSKIDPGNIKNVERKWEDLTNLLNSSGSGPKKSMKEWKRVISEWKYSIKKRARQIKLDLVKTGGGKSTIKPLNEIEERLLQLTGKISVEGADLPEAGFEQQSTTEPKNMENVPEAFIQNLIFLEEVNSFENVAPQDQEIIIEETEIIIEETEKSVRKTQTGKKRKSEIQIEDEYIKVLKENTESNKVLAEANNKVAEANLKVAESNAKLAEAINFYVVNKLNQNI